jgi:hypothetical protein
MNRIILIGNGFDLAHGMKTGYNDFLDDFWNQTVEKVRQAESQIGVSFQDQNIQVYGTKQFGVNYNYNTKKRGFQLFRHYTSIYDFQYQMKNQFLEGISKFQKYKNWVDIEHEYYHFLTSYIELSEERRSKSIEKLNDDFRSVSTLLEEYLRKIESEFKGKHDQKIENAIGTHIFSTIEYDDVSEEGIESIVDRLYMKRKREHEEKIDNLNTYFNLSSSKFNSIQAVLKIKKEIKAELKSKKGTAFSNLIPEKILFLNFNYTSTDLKYADAAKFQKNKTGKISETEVIRIHGSLYDPDYNPIIFGYGDELDETYHEMEKLNDNRFLENIKSMKYLETNNYKKLLEFINLEEYQIFLFGHSCGVSDRTLLNTLFEHKNCVSIKPFYHQKDENTDNFSDIVRNISRNFNDKVLMRSKVVDKSLCKPLTQHSER